MARRAYVDRIAALEPAVRHVLQDGPVPLPGLRDRVAAAADGMGIPCEEPTAAFMKMLDAGKVQLSTDRIVSLCPTKT